MDMDEKRMQSVCFSGHRNAEISPAVQTIFDIMLHTRVLGGGSDFYSGGAMGWDAFCSKRVIAFRNSGFNVRLHLILPYCFEEYTKMWTKHERRELLEIKSQADTVEYITEQFAYDSMKQRNQKLVNRAGWLWCFYDEKRFRSGTGQTFRMAERDKLRIRNLNI